MSFNFRQFKRYFILGIIVISSIFAMSLIPVLAQNIGQDHTSLNETNNFKLKSENDDQLIYTFDNSARRPVQNPFPNIISDEEVKNANGSIAKVFFIPEATTNNPHPQWEHVDANNFINPISTKKGTYKAYAVFKFPTLAYPAKLFVNARETRNGLKLKDGGIYFGSKKTVPYVSHPYTCIMNGVKLADNSLKQVLVEIDNKNPASNFYYELSWPSEMFDERSLINFGVAQTTGGYVRTTIIRDFVPFVDAQFHFVDDLEYRQKQGLNLHDPLPERGNSDKHPKLSKAEKELGTVLSAIPFHEIKGLNNILGVKNITTDAYHYLRNKNGDIATSLLSFADDPKIQYVKRPRMNELTQQDIPGYVYWDNDIDKPNNAEHEFKNDNYTKELPGNHYLSFAYDVDKDGNPVKLLKRKHYYVCFRELPTQLIVRYKKADGTYEHNNNFELSVNHKKLPGTFVSLAEVKEPTKQELIAMMKDKSTSLIADGKGYSSKNSIYLTTGNYSIHPTLKAPKGYEWVPADKNGDNFNIMLQKNDHAKTQKIVTFVLQKKAPKPTALTPATTTVKVESIWQDTKGQKIEAPVKEIEVELYRDDVVSGFKQKLKKANKWQVEFTDLAISESLQSKKEYQYTVKEIGEKDNLIKYGNKTYDVLYTGDMVKGFKVIHKERIEKPKQPHVDNHIVKTPNTSDCSFSLLSVLGISLIALTFISCKYMKKSH